MNCITCTKSLTGKQTRFCSKKCKGKLCNDKHQSYDAQQKRALKRKIKYINILGGKCSNCGYNRNLSALDFHHVDGKDFSLDARSLSNRSEEVVLPEILRCVILCANCHREHHHPQYFDWASRDSNPEP